MLYRHVYGYPTVHQYRSDLDHTKFSFRFLNSRLLHRSCASQRILRAAPPRQRIIDNLRIANSCATQRLGFSQRFENKSSIFKIRSFRIFFQMSNKIVVISSKNLQTLAGLQCYVQDASGAPGQIQEIADVQTFAVSDASGGDGVGPSGAPSVQRVAGAPVSVCFGSGQVLNSVVTISSASASGDAISSPPQLEAIVGAHGDDGDGDDPSENVSAEDYSFQENEDDLMPLSNGRRRSDLMHGAGSSPNIRAPSMNLRYTGTRIPGRGFDGGVGKSFIYRDGVQRELTLPEVIDILANPDLSKLSSMPPIRPRGGTMYLYRCPDYETRHDLRADGYLWIQQGTKKIPKEDPAVKRFYMYIRTEEPIKNVSKRPKKTFTKYDVRFKKCEYELINAEDPLVLVHYTGDESVWKPFRQTPASRSDEQRRYLQASKRDMAGGLPSRPRDAYQNVMTGPVTEGYESVATPRDREQMRSYLKFYNRSRTGQGGIAGSPSKRPRSSEAADADYNETAVAAETILSADSQFGAMDDTVVNESIDSRRSDAVEQFTVPQTAVEEDTVGAGRNNAEIRSKFESMWPTFEMCQNVRMQGFVHALSVVPQVVVTAACRTLLNVANDLAQLQAMKKTTRFEFYYVSAGPVAGGHYLSTLLFRHCLFDVEPIVPVAFLVHERRNPGDHRRLFELIKEKCPDVAQAECVFITDREYGNVSSVLPKAVQLYSWHYIEDDVVGWVESNGGSSEEANTYLSDVQALMKTKDLDRFNRDLALKRRQWPAQFSNFFDTCLKPDIVSKGGRWRSDGLPGGVYDPFCGVVIPSCNYLNELVGDLVAWHEATLEQLLQSMYYFSEYYVREIERSMHQLGNFKLFPQFAHYARPPRRLRSFPELEVTDPRQIVQYIRMSS